MKRSLALAISVLALTAVAEPLFAAESETAAPVERERAAPPSARRAQPARTQQRAAPQRQAPQQQASQTSSYTGTQAGGFGGGNAGGGGFADPGFGACLASAVSPPNARLGPPSTSRSGAIPAASAAPLLSIRFQWRPSRILPSGQIWLVAGIMGDFSGGKTTATSTQSFTYPSEPLINPLILTSETYRNSVSQGTSGSVRLKFGAVVPVAGLWGSVMPYVTIGWMRSHIDGNFSYASSSYAPGCAPFSPTCSVIAASGVNWSQSRNGVVTGVGVEIPIGFGPGVVLVADWTYANFGSFDVPLAFAVATPCVPSAGTACGAVDVAHVSNLSSNRFSLGAKFKLF